MRKITTLCLVATLILTSCGHKGYTVTGVMPESMDGDTVFIAAVGGDKLELVDTAFVANGTFTFTGVQEVPVNRYLVYKGMDDLRPYRLNFFLENGRIDVQMAREDGAGVISGTTTNNAYQQFNESIRAIMLERNKIYEMSAETDEERDAKMQALNDVNDQMITAMKQGIEKNLSSSLGVYLLGSYYHSIENSELENYINQLPAALQEEATIVKLKEYVEVVKATSKGQKYIDFELNDTKDNPVKLSDYVGKHKLVLVDFWASWCGPCRRDMPKVVEAYAIYKSKGLEIVGVSLDSNADAWKKSIDALGVTWPQMSDLKGWGSEAGKLYGVRSIPHMMLIDQEGVIVARGVHAKDLQEKLEELL